MEIIQIKPAVYRIKTKAANVILDKSVVINAKSEPFTISEPGEYEVEGVSVFGFGVGEGKAIYLIVTEGLRALYLGALETELTETQVEELGQVDILIAGVANVKLLVSMIEKIEPTYILPYEAGVEVSSFVTAYEHGSREAANLSVSVATLPMDLTEVVTLTTG